MCLGGVTKAHPHVFVDARTGFIFGSDQHHSIDRLDPDPILTFQTKQAL